MGTGQIIKDTLESHRKGVIRFGKGQLVCDRRQVSSISEMAKEKGHSQTVVAYGAWKVSMSVKNAVSVLGV